MVKCFSRHPKPSLLNLHCVVLHLELLNPIFLFVYKNIFVIKLVGFVFIKQKEIVWTNRFVVHDYGSQSTTGSWCVHMNNECSVYTLLPTESFRQTIPLAGEETARLVSTERHLVTLPLPSRVKVVFTPFIISILTVYHSAMSSVFIIGCFVFFTYSWSLCMHGAMKICCSQWRSVICFFLWQLRQIKLYISTWAVSRYQSAEKDWA